jgi:hypothetical protein
MSAQIEAYLDGLEKRKRRQRLDKGESAVGCGGEARERAQKVAKAKRDMTLAKGLKRGGISEQSDESTAVRGESVAVVKAGTEAISSQLQSANESAERLMVRAR